jgi:hypothetical protein
MPRLSDADDLALINSVIATISGNLAGYPPLVAADMTAFGTIRDAFANDLLLHNQQQDAARAQTIAKDASRTAADLELRRIRELIKAHGVSDANYAALGIPQAESLTPSTATVPVANVDTSERLQHTINFADASAPNIKRRPAGTIDLEIWNKIDGPLPGASSTDELLTLDTQHPVHDGVRRRARGQDALMCLRWQFAGVKTFSN